MRPSMFRRPVLSAIVASSLICLMTHTAPSALADESNSDGTVTAWSTYTNAEFGYTIQHPTDMIVREWTPGDDILANVTFYPRDDQNPSGGSAGLSVLVFCNASGLNAYEWVASRPEFVSVDSSDQSAAASTSTTTQATTAVLDGLPAVSFRANLEQSVEHMVLSRDSVIIDIASADSGKDEDRKLFDEMRATVRFTSAESGDGAPCASKSNEASEGIIQNAPDVETKDAPSKIEEQADLSVVGYRLPFRLGYAYRIVQSWNNSPTHSGTQYYAYDFDNDTNGLMEGVPVLASEGGTIRFVQSGKTACGGPGTPANYVTIYHDDGSATLYLHLKEVMVTSGTVVARGTVVGLAGKTGETATSQSDCIPHLHFQRQSQGAWFTQSRSISFDEYPSQQLSRYSRYTSNNADAGCRPPADGIVLYEHWGYGRCYAFTDSQTNFNNIGFNDIASSIEFRGRFATGWTVQVFEHTDSNGISSTFTGTDWDFGNDTIGHDRASSILLRSSSSNCLAQSPHEYPNNYHSTWTVTNPDSSATISRLHFSRIDLEQGCQCDRIEIMGGDGRVYDSTYTSYPNGAVSNEVPGRAIQVRLVSDASITAWGFCVDSIETVSRGSQQSPTSIEVVASRGWQSTGISVQQGEEVALSYVEGEWTGDTRHWPYVDADGYGADPMSWQGCKVLQTVTYGTLLGRVGGGSTFRVGNGGHFRASAAGTLQLRMNDGDGCLTDNDGSIVVAVQRGGGSSGPSNPTCSGTRVGVNTVVQGTAGSSSQPVRYCVDLSRGDWISIRVFPFNNSMDPVLDVTSPPVGNISSAHSRHDDEDNNHRNSFVAFDVGTSGTYILDVSPYGSGGAFRMAIDRGRKAGSADVNTDCVVNTADLAMFTGRFGSSDRNLDVNVDGIVNSLDYALAAGWVGKECE